MITILPGGKMEPSTSINPVQMLRLWVFTYRPGKASLAFHPSRPYWHYHSPRLWSGPDD